MSMTFWTLLNMITFGVMLFFNYEWNKVQTSLAKKEHSMLKTTDALMSANGQRKGVGRLTYEFDIQIKILEQKQIALKDLGLSCAIGWVILAGFVATLEFILGW